MTSVIDLILQSSGGIAPWVCVGWFTAFACGFNASNAKKGCAGGMCWRWSKLRAVNGLSVGLAGATARG